VVAFLALVGAFFAVTVCNRTFETRTRVRYNAFVDRENEPNELLTLAFFFLTAVALGFFAAAFAAALSA